MLLWCSLVLGCFLMVHGDIAEMGQCPNVKTSLGSVRKRRHLEFPDGSFSTITMSVTKAFMTHAPAGWFAVADVDILFPLPDRNFTASHLRRKLHHRQKRDAWDRLRGAFDVHNMNGHACIMRTICEAKMHLAPKGHSLVHDVLRAVFVIPSYEKEFEEEIGGTFEDVFDPELCERLHECPISLLQFILGLNSMK